MANVRSPALLPRDSRSSPIRNPNRAASAIRPARVSSLTVVRVAACSSVIPRRVMRNVSRCGSHRVATAHRALGTLYRGTKRPGEAEAAYLRAIGLGEALLRRHPGLDAYERELAMTLRERGELHQCVD